MVEKRGHKDTRHNDKNKNILQSILSSIFKASFPNQDAVATFDETLKKTNIREK